MTENATDYLLTTKDNPYNPWTDFNSWQRWDESAGYYTLPLLGRVVLTSNDLSEADESLAIDLAMNEIISENVSGMHTKVAAPVTEKPLAS